MSKFGKVLLVIFILGVLTAVSFFLINYFHPKGAGISVEATPVSTVYIDGVEVGTTPYEGIRNPGEIVIKLIPSDPSFLPYETKVNLVSTVRTVVKREFGESEETSSGEIASFEKIGGKEAAVSIISSPDAAQISIDGRPRGFSPYKINSIVPGEHKLVVSSVGYKERLITINAYEGYKMTIVVSLSRDKIQPQQTPAPQESKKTSIVVEILETPNNFLRVREEPSADGKEITRVTTGKTYPFLEEDTKGDWYKIEYETGKSGWVSADYCKKIDPNKVSPTPRATLAP